MATQDCDGCGRSVRIAGGVDDLWTFDAETSEGLTLELTDGSEHFLCFDCVEELPDDRDPTAEDVAELAERRDGPDEVDAGDADEVDAGDADHDATDADDDDADDGEDDTNGASDPNETAGADAAFDGEAADEADAEDA